MQSLTSTSFSALCRRLCSGALAALLAVGLSGCGGGDDDDSGVLGATGLQRSAPADEANRPTAP